MMRLLKAIGAFVLAFVIWTVVFALLNSGPQQPPEWWTFFFVYGEIWGVAYLLHLLIHALWTNLPGAIVLTLVQLFFSWVYAKSIWDKRPTVATTTFTPPTASTSWTSTPLTDDD